MRNQGIVWPFLEQPLCLMDLTLVDLTELYCVFQLVAENKEVHLNSEAILSSSLVILVCADPSVYYYLVALLHAFYRQKTSFKSGYSTWLLARLIFNQPPPFVPIPKSI